MREGGGGMDYRDLVDADVKRSSFLSASQQSRLSIAKAAISIVSEGADAQRPKSSNFFRRISRKKLNVF